MGLAPDSEEQAESGGSGGGEEALGPGGARQVRRRRMSVGHEVDLLLHDLRASPEATACFGGKECGAGAARAPD